MNRKISFLSFNNRIKTMLTIAVLTIVSCVSLFATDTCARPGANERFLKSDSVIYYYDSPIELDSEMNYVTVPFGDTENLYLADSVVDSLCIYKDSAEYIRQNLITEVGYYISRYAPRSKMSAEYIVDACLDKEFDITLLMAQGHLETHFATRGSNNCFGIGNRKRYKHPNESVDDYLDLMKRKYVINRTTEQLLASNVRMENSKSSYYSSQSSYGAKVKKIRDDIKQNTNIHELFYDLLEVNSLIGEYES